MKVTELAKAEKVPFNLDGRKMFVDQRVEIIHLTLGEGELLEKHTNPFDVAIYILEGEGIVETDEESACVMKDFCIEIKAGIPRGVKNTSSKKLRLLVVKIFDR